ncbi:MAG: PTS sugar transporter subunit IIA [Proteobacteria bacterium]|nr:PTS sugar transporter subunit IIA [Pseudomonadota bacterium]
MLISEFLIPECIRVDMECNSKDDLLKELVELQFNAHPEVDRNETILSLYEREELLSTGIGEGIAIPHARVSSCKSISVSFGLLKKGINFNSLDSKPVRIVLLILFPKDKVNLQLRFLARVSRVLQHRALHDELYQSKSPEEVIKVFQQYEEQHFH